MKEHSTPIASVLIGSRNRPTTVLAAVKSALVQSVQDVEVLVLDDCSEEASAYPLAIAQLNDERVRLLRSARSLGVAGGRNLLEQAARASVLIILDDDAVFDDVEAIARLVSIIEHEPNVGIVAVKVRDFRNGKESLLVPFSRAFLHLDPKQVDRAQDVAYYVGTCHAVTRKCLEACGGYRDDMVYGSEELDRSYRAIQQGYRIQYAPEVVISHHPAPSVVVQQSQHNGEVYHDLRNRYYIAYRYLPWQYALSYETVWTVRTLVRCLARRQLFDWLHTLHGVRAWARKNTTRQPLNAQQVAYVKEHHGRLWY